MIYSIWIRPQGSLGCQNVRQGPLNTPFEAWCANIAPKLKNIQNTLRKQVFFWHFFSILMIFRSFSLFRAILAQKLNSFICEKKILIFWHPWDPWERVHIDLNKNSVWTGCVLRATSGQPSDVICAKVCNWKILSIAAEKLSDDLKFQKLFDRQ